MIKISLRKKASRILLIFFAISLISLLYQQGQNFIVNAAANPSKIGKDITPPTIQITYPLMNSTFHMGEKVVVKTTAFDKVGVFKVEFREDWKFFCKDTLPPFECIYYTTQSTYGPHNIWATAFDLAGNTATQIVTIYVK